MPNGDSIKKSTKHELGHELKARAMANAAKKVKLAKKKELSAHNVAALHEDSVKRTPHEGEMAEQKQKREAKKAKDAEFRAR